MKIMKGNLLRFASVGMLVFISISALSQTIWDGSPITFTKENYANWTLPENQDRITDDIWITRANTKPIFNIAMENLDQSPKDTRWAVGSISDGVETLTFDSWLVTIEENPPNMVGVDMVLYLVTDDIYIDIKFTSWTSGAGNGGGGFSYERSTGDISERLWTGPITTFTKADYADWTVAGNQDRISDNVWITRADTRGLFNIAQEDAYLFTSSTPTKTLWAFGTTDDGIGTLSFDYFLETIDFDPPSMLNRDMVLQLVPHEICLLYTSDAADELR